MLMQVLQLEKGLTPNEYISSKHFLPNPPFLCYFHIHPSENEAADSTAELWSVI